MRIIYWTEQYWPSIGGLEVLGTRYCTALKQRGYDVHVITSHGNNPLPDEDEHLGVPIHRFPFYQALVKRDIELLLTTRMRLNKLWNDLNPDLVHMGVIAPSTFFLLQKMQGATTPLVINMQLGALTSQQGEHDSIMEKAIEAATWVTTVSKSILDETRDRVPAKADQCSVIYNALEPPELEPEPIDTDNPTLLCLGRLMPVKGFDIAMRALPKVLERHPNARVIVAGDGAERQNLEQIVNELGLQKAVEFLGWVQPDDVPALLNRATIGVFPSRDEPFGLVALEAGLMKRPVVATRVGGLPEVVDDGVTGLLVPPEDTDALAGAINEMLNAPARMIKMGEAGKQKAARDFSWDRYMQEYEDLYRQLAPDATVSASS